MRTVVVLNGEPCDFVFDKSDLIISCDGALRYLESQGVTPDVVLGDFDSLGYVPDGAIKVDAEKDFTDGEMALSHAIKSGADDVVFICAGGLREDHFLGNLALLKAAHKKGVTARAETAYSTILFAKSPLTVKTFVGQTVSVVATDGDALIRWSSGLKYVYRDTILGTDTTLGVSNVATKNEISLDIAKGSVFVILNKSR